MFFLSHCRHGRLVFGRFKTKFEGFQKQLAAPMISYVKPCPGLRALVTGMAILPSITQLKANLILSVVPLDPARNYLTRPWAWDFDPQETCHVMFILQS
jgi:hypothetical protein